MQAFAGLRADDPAAAVRIFEAALAASGAPPAVSSPVESPHADESPHAEEAAARRELTQGLWRARILAGDPAEPLAQARDLLDRVDTVENRLDYALLLLAAQQTSAARAQPSELTPDPGSGA